MCCIQSIYPVRRWWIRQMWDISSQSMMELCEIFNHITKGISFFETLINCRERNCFTTLRCTSAQRWPDDRRRSAAVFAAAQSHPWDYVKSCKVPCRSQDFACAFGSSIRTNFRVLTNENFLASLLTCELSLPLIGGRSPNGLPMKEIKEKQKNS